MKIINGGRLEIGHRLAFSRSYERRAHGVVFEEKMLNDGGPSICNLRKQITFGFCLSPHWGRNFLTFTCFSYMHLQLTAASFLFFSLSAIYLSERQSAYWQNSQY